MSLKYTCKLERRNNGKWINNPGISVAKFGYYYIKFERAGGGRRERRGVDRYLIFIRYLSKTDRYVRQRDRNTYKETYEQKCNKKAKQTKKITYIFLNLINLLAKNGHTVVHRFMNIRFTNCRIYETNKLLPSCKCEKNVALTSSFFLQIAYLSHRLFSDLFIYFIFSNTRNA